MQEQCTVTHHRIRAQSKQMWDMGGGGVFARRATFVLIFLAPTPGLPSPRGAPQADQSGAQTFPTKHVA